MPQDPNVPSGEWERFRDFLLVLARANTDVRWQGKIDASGVVQQTLLEAFQASPQMGGWNDAQKAAWLRRALANNLNDEVRKLKTAKREVGRERSLEAQLAESVSRMERLLPAAQSTPSQHVAKEEATLRLVRALAQLPENQRQVVELHHLGGQTLMEVAERLGTTKPAVAGLLHRALKRLRELLMDEPSSR